VLVLVFLGGVIVLVVYMCTLCSNEKFRVSHYPRVLILLLAIRCVYWAPVLPGGTLNSCIRGTPYLYEFSQIIGLVYLIGFLMLALVCVVKLVKFEAGPLVKRL